MNWLQNLELGIQWKVKATRFNCLIFEQKPVLLKVSEKEDEELKVLEEFVRRGNLQVPHTHSCKWNTKLFDFNVWSALTIPWRNCTGCKSRRIGSNWKERWDCLGWEESQRCLRGRIGSLRGRDWVLKLGWKKSLSQKIDFRYLTEMIQWIQTWPWCRWERGS